MELSKEEKLNDRWFPEETSFPWLICKTIFFGVGTIGTSQKYYSELQLNIPPKYFRILRMYTIFMLGYNLYAIEDVILHRIKYPELYENS